MGMLDHIELRKKFLDFFEGRGHTIYSSFSLVPVGDPSLLFTSAGMVPFKDYFTGKKKDLKRAASCQKCLRTGDIDSVGKTPFHHTFFEMLGNFSFGDYFKEEAIAWAWEFLTDELALDPDRLYISVHKDDKESFEIWNKKINIPEDRIYLLGDDTNFWPANAPRLGPDGPCGPCSEIYYDRGEKYCPKKDRCKLVICEGTGKEKCYRCVEVWNLVFTQFNRVGVDRLEPLPNKNIDTGMGFERLLCILEGKESNYDTSLFNECFSILETELKIKDGFEITKRRILDHLRAVTFAIADGVIPSNTGRGYVIRKLLKRAVVEANSTPYYNLCTLYKIAHQWIEKYKDVYPELIINAQKVDLYIKTEEEKFLSHRNEYNEYINSVLSKSGSIISGFDAFLLYDTYGIPLDLIMELASTKGKTIDEEEFNQYLQQQKERSRRSSKLVSEVFINEGVAPVDVLQSSTTFVGYEKLETESIVKAIIVDKEPVEYMDSKNKEFIVIIDPTPFYGEEGGQVGDTGVIVSESALVEVIDTKKDDELIYSICKLKEGKLSLYSKVKAVVAQQTRLNTAKNHTATHMLHSALRKFLGSHIQQSGSLVAPFKLRFDFSHPKKLTSEEIETIEAFVNKKVLENHPVIIEEKNLEEARKEGALAFFGDKYKNKVRVVTIGDFSKELCGGTHLSQTALVGFLKVVNEESIAQGIRRIEAVTGEQAIKMASNDSSILKKITQLLQVPKDQLFEKLDKLLQLNIQLQKELVRYRVKEVLQIWNNLLSNKEKIKSINGFSYTALQCEELMKELINALPALLEKYKIDILFVSSSEQPVKIAVLVSNMAKNKNLSAEKLLKGFLEKYEGAGGGSTALAQGILKNVEKTQPPQLFMNYLSNYLQNLKSKV